MAKFHACALLVLLCTSPIGAKNTEIDAGSAFAVREFGDWSTACDNSGECNSVSVSRAYVKRTRSTDPGDYATPKLWVKRGAGPDARPHIFVDTSVWGEANSDAALTLHVYYDCAGECTGRAYSLKQIGQGRYELAPEHVAAFFTESTNTRRAVTRRDDGSIHGIVTTDGLIAAMRFIDENQGRRGTVTSIYSKGKMPASTVPPEHARPSITILRGVEAPTIEMRDATALQQKRREYCDGDTDRIESNMQSFTFTIGQKLWSIDCSVNPYDETRLWLIQAVDGSFQDIKFPRPDLGFELDQERGRSVNPPILPNSDFDPVSGMITSYSGGMCGWRRRWGWTGTGFEMLDSIEMPSCIDILPQNWLQTYRAVTE